MKKFHFTLTKSILFIGLICSSLSGFGQSKFTCTPATLAFTASGGSMDVTISGSGASPKLTCSSSFFVATLTGAKITVTCFPNTTANARGAYVFLDNGKTGQILVTQSTTSGIPTNLPSPLSASAASGTGTGTLQNLNYITTCTVLKENIKTDADLQTATIGDIQEATTYFDGLGRPIQSVNTQASPDKNDIVQYMEYDQFGREAVKYLPFVSGNDGKFKTDALTSQNNFYSTANGISIPQDAKPYAVTVFESSPLNRVLQQGAPGADFQPSNGHAVGMSYLTNGSEVMLFTVSGNTCTKSSTNYAAAQLFLNQVTDENGNISKEYKDKEGHVVLKAVMKDASTTLSTYYVYDDFENLRFVLPPRAVEYIVNNGISSITQTDATLKDLIYYYRYDDKKRLVEKQLPGADPVYMVYDQRDRLILTQDGNNRNKAGGARWLFTKYDVLNRPVLTGVANLNISTQADMQAQYEANSPAVVNETRSTATIGYTSNAYPQTVEKYLTATYYDDYTFTGALAFDASNNISTYSGSYMPIVKGHPTGTRVLILDDNTTPSYILTTTYYDDHYRPIEVLRSNILPSSTTTTEVLSTKYDFAGRAMESKQVQNIEGAVTTLGKRNTYDHASRLTKTELNINNAGYKTQSEATFTPLGQAFTKRIGGGVDENYFTYTIRGWLKSMNGMGLSARSHLGLNLSYNNSMGDLSNTAQWNGNISGIKWFTPSSAETFGYAYTYDALNRLTGADFGRSGSSSNWPSTDAYDERNITYDSNGNILTYKRYDGNGAIMDDMVYTYLNNNYSNKLQKITDSYSGGFPVTSSISVPNFYNYDTNGNLTHDETKTLNGITYNELNLPKSMDFSNSRNITYTYDAAGTKLCKQTATSDANQATMQYYAGNMIYDKNKSLLFILTDEGRAVKNGTSFAQEYFVKDHLGDTRLVLNESGSIIQETHYYPFGLAMKGLGSVDKTSPKNEYLYNGKEMQEDFGLNWEDYGARFYDAVIGRWWSVDPLAEKSRRWSPYVYCYNDPLRFVDPDGMEAITPDEKKVKDLEQALKGKTVQERTKNVIKEFKKGDYLTASTLLSLAKVSAKAQKGESISTTATRNIISNIEKVEKTDNGFIVKLKDNKEISQIMPIMKPDKNGKMVDALDLNLTIKSNAIINISANDKGGTVIDIQGVKVGKYGMSVGIPNITLNNDNGSIYGISFPTNKK